MLAEAATRAIPLLLLSAILGSTQQAAPNLTGSALAPSQKTLAVNCQEDKPEHVLSPISLSQDQNWRAYVEVDVQTGCLHTTQLWVGPPNAPYRVAYLMPPKPYAVGNGMDILGWSTSSNLLLVKTEEWPDGSDAEDTQGVLAIDAATGMVYDADLEAILQGHKDKRCFYRIVDAGFTADRGVNILVRARLSTQIDPGDTEDDVPPAQRCGNAEETWSFNLLDRGAGEIKQVPNTEPLQLFRNFLPNRPDN
jgi:hypothetical protein